MVSSVVFFLMIAARTIRSQEAAGKTLQDFMGWENYDAGSALHDAPR
jgi:hypothetical protein